MCVCVCVCLSVCLSVTTLAATSFVFTLSKAGTWGVVIGFSWILTRGFSKKLPFESYGMKKPITFPFESYGMKKPITLYLQSVVYPGFARGGVWSR